MEIIQYTNSNISQDNLQNFSQSNQDVTSFGFVSYDKDTYKVIGEYSNELYLFRAKKLWKMVLQDTFLLEEVTDFKFQVRKNSKLNVFTDDVRVVERVFLNFSYSPKSCLNAFSLTFLSLLLINEA